MKIQSIKDGFLGSEGILDYTAPYPKAKAVIIPFGFEATVSYGHGTAQGPKAIIEASHQIEAVDEQSQNEVYRCGIATLKQPAIPRQPKHALQLLSRIVAQVVQDGKFPLVLGGEHSLTQGALRGVSAKYHNFSVLQFDAHSDMRRTFHKSTYSHAAVMHQSLKNLPIAKVIQVGIRTLGDSEGELEFRKAYHQQITTFWGWEKIKPQAVVKAIKTKQVYITFDVDAFDPSVIPATGTPEPGGLYWWETLSILKTVFKHKQVIGADVVELAPIPRLHFPNFTIARLVYKMIGYKFYDRLKF